MLIREVGRWRGGGRERADGVVREGGRAVLRAGSATYERVDCAK